MSAIIRDGRGNADNVTELNSSQIWRTLEIGSDWTELHIGILAGFSTLPVDLTGEFYCGIGSGTTNKIGDPTTDNWFGAAYRGGGTWRGGLSALGNAGTMTGDTATYSIYVQTGHRRGSTWTQDATAAAGNNTRFPADYTNNFHAHILGLELTKNGASSTMSVLHTGTTNAIATTYASLITAMDADPMALASYGTVASASGLNFDEATFGNLDTIQIYWTGAFEFNIIDLYVKKIS